MRDRKPLKIAVAVDSFKGTLTSLQAAACIEKGFRKVMPRAKILKLPMADGGEGTVNALVAATGGRVLRRTVSDPLGRPVRSFFGVTGDARTAVVEMAAASGLPLLKPDERNPLLTTTRGTGELIRHALETGVKRIIVGVGGSATCDGGAGMAAALGARLLDKDGQPIPDGGGALLSLRQIDLTGLDARVRNVRIEVACDVDNPLTGPAGAARVYGPQKGATPAMIAELDAGLTQFAEVARAATGVSLAALPGAGAAGGLAGGLVAILGATLSPGVQTVLDAIRFRRRVRGYDLVITGEGRMDGQTARGKTPAGVARTARELGIPVIAICGSLSGNLRALHDLGIAACFSALQEIIREEDLPRRASAMLTNCAEQVARLFSLQRL